MSVRLGAELAWALVTRSRWWLFALLAALGVAARGVFDRTSDASGSDRTLLGVTLGLAIPLTAYTAFEAVHRRQATSWVTAPLARHGADRHALGTGVLLVPSALSALVAAVLSALAVVAASSARAGLFADLVSSAWSGALVGAAYAGLLAFASRWGRAGRLWLLGCDLLFGSGSGIFALPWVRAHARSLLGGDPVLGSSVGFSIVALVLVAALGVAGTARRGPN